MSFQKCPACDGTGAGDNNGQPWFGIIPPPCPVCNGGRIIDAETGEPLAKTRIITTNTISIPCGEDK